MTTGIVIRVRFMNAPVNVVRPAPIKLPESTGYHMPHVVDRLLTVRGQLMASPQMRFDAIHYNEALTIDLMRRFPRDPSAVIPVAIHSQAAIAMSKATPGFQQSEVQFMFLTAGLAVSPPTDALECFLFPEGSTSLRQPPMR